MPSPSSDESSTVTIVLIAAGCIVGVLLISFAAYMITQKCKNKNNNSSDANGERAFLLGINAEGSSGVNTKQKWPFGDLDHAGVTRILKWLKEIVAPSANNNSFDDGISSFCEHQTLLGEDDGLTTPTQRYSPRVSNVSQMGSNREDCNGDRLVDDERD